MEEENPSFFLSSMLTASLSNGEREAFSQTAPLSALIWLRFRVSPVRYRSDKGIVALEGGPLC